MSCVIRHYIDLGALPAADLLDPRLLCVLCVSLSDFLQLAPADPLLPLELDCLRHTSPNFFSVLPWTCSQLWSLTLFIASVRDMR
jgi:hypothetical protein